MTDEKRETFLVTGGGGFLGRYICEGLKQQGHHVKSYSRNTYPELEEQGIECHRGGLEDTEELKNALEDVNGVFHVASKVGMWGRWRDFYQTNVEGTQNLLNACREKGIDKLVYTSTPSVVFEFESIENGDETHPYAENSKSLYAKSKTLAEKSVLQEKNIKTCALRPHLIYGPRDPNLIPRILKKAKAGKLLQVGDGSNCVDIVDVEYAAEAHLKAYEQLKKGNIQGEVFFIAQASVNLWNFINQILAQHNIAPIKKKISFPLAYILGASLEILFTPLLFLGIKKEPPMTRFVALQLGKSHYFSHEKANKKLKLSSPPKVEESLKKLSTKNF